MAIDASKLSDIPEMRAEQIAAMIPDEEWETPPETAAEPAPTEPPAPEPEAAAPETAPSAEEAAPVEPEAPAIDPPATWKADLKDRWSKLPQDLQRDLAQWESERNAGVSRRLEEAAEKAKAAEQERVRFAQLANQYVQLASDVDPIIAEGRKTDWVALARENPAEAQVRYMQYQHREGQLAQAMQQRQAALADHYRTTLAREEEALLNAVPEWKADRSKAQSDMDSLRRTAAQKYGFRAEELAGLADHRQALVLRDAMRYHELIAKQRAVAQTKVAAKPVPKVIRPGAAPEPKSVEQERVAGVKAQLKGVRDPHAIAAKIASIL